MTFDAPFVATLAELARLEVTPAEAERMAGELSRVLAYVDQLAQVEPGPALDVGACPRGEDTPRTFDPTALLQQSAGWRGEGGVYVPTVVEVEE